MLLPPNPSHTQIYIYIHVHSASLHYYMYFSMKRWVKDIMEAGGKEVVSASTLTTETINHHLRTHPVPPMF
tara:strand:+ start:1093 stop:1305 length:213 start_codon:yes stop_codon:yes gene_type:complete